MKLLPEDIFAALNRDQFIKLLEYGVEIWLEDQIDILSQMEPRFLNKYARIAKYTPKQLNEKVQGRYAYAENVSEASWSFWFAYLQILRKRLNTKTGEDDMTNVDVECARELTQNQEMNKKEAKEVSARDKMIEANVWDGNLSKEALELVDDVGAEFEKSGLDK